jgi:ankyrin repeat protein
MATKADCQSQPNRRVVLRGTGAVGALSLLAACDRKGDALQKLWTQWQADWRWMEAIAKRRQWELRPLKIAPPAAHAALDAVERRHGLKFPPQLRAVLTELSAHVQFGWHIPSHLQAFEREDMPYGSGIRDTVWDLDVIDQNAIPSFLGWKRELAKRDRSEAPNTPQMWETQFPFGHLPNGDILTIDMSKPEPARQPVRYFSHDLEMIHGLALAPDYYSFVTVYAKLGCAGSEWASWMRFGMGIKDDTFYLSAETEGAKKWLAWSQRDPVETKPDEPPVVVVEKTSADRALLKAARANALPGVKAALAQGAQPDCTWNQKWLSDFDIKDMRYGEEFSTAAIYATRSDNIEMLEILLKAGATLNTRRLVMTDAMERGSLSTVEWLIGKGARANGWKHDRKWPLHMLVTHRAKAKTPSFEDYKAEMSNPEMTQASYERTVPRAIDEATYVAMLDALLKAGAKPDAPWDNGITMLMYGGVVTGKALLARGANVHARDANGWTVLHWARTPEKVDLLVAQGADVNARASPRTGDENGLPSTALQHHLLGAISREMAVVTALLRHGADPKHKDGAGRSTLAYCFEVECFKLILGYGLDPKERLPDGGTLLHNLAATSSVRAAFSEEVAFFKYLLSLGLDINATDSKGQTMLHRLAERVGEPKDIALYLASSADKSIKDKAGQRAYDLAPKSLKDVREMLR